jgi:hypothetical protein
VRGGVTLARSRLPIAPQPGADKMVRGKKVLEILAGCADVNHDSSPLPKFRSLRFLTLNFELLNLEQLQIVQRFNVQGSRSENENSSRHSIIQMKKAHAVVHEHGAAFVCRHAFESFRQTFL